MIGGSLASIQVIMNEMKYILFGKFFVPTQNDGDVVSQSIFSRPLPASFFLALLLTSPREPSGRPFPGAIRSSMVR